MIITHDSSPQVSKPSPEQKLIELEQQIIELKILLEIAKNEARTDHLTGIPNRRTLEVELHTNVADAIRSYFSLLVIETDIDRFKLVNDRYGHPQGDVILKQYTKRTQEVLRDTDILGRWGGEEFLIIMPIPHQTSLGDIEKFFRRMQIAVATINRSNDPQEGHQKLTFSAGAVIIEAGQKSVDIKQLLHQVDSALYVSKKTRNTYTIKKYILK